MYSSGSVADVRTIFILFTPDSHPKQAPKTPGGVIRLHAVVIDEHPAIAPVAKERPSEHPDIGRRLKPAGRLQIKLTERLQRPVLLFRQQLDAHRGRHLARAALGLVLLSGGTRFGVVTGASAPCGAFRGAVTEDHLTGFAGFTQNVRLTAAGL